MLSRKGFRNAIGGIAIFGMTLTSFRTRPLPFAFMSSKSLFARIGNDVIMSIFKRSDEAVVTEIKRWTESKYFKMSVVLDYV